MDNDKNDKHTDALALFLAEWKALPPLVRASLAHNELKHVNYVGGQLDKEARNYASTLPRRTRVTRHFQAGYNILGDLLLSLCEIADDEAETSGLGPLDTGE